jgi:hypothetical protein
MITTLPHQETRPRTAAAHAGACLGRLVAALAAVTCAVLAVAAAGPAAFARPVPPPGGSWTTPVTPLAPATVRVISTGGMAGWQIALIAIGAALVAAAAAILLDRTLASRRSTTTTSA